MPTKSKVLLDILRNAPITELMQTDVGSLGVFSTHHQPKGLENGFTVSLVEHREAAGKRNYELQVSARGNNLYQEEQRGDSSVFARLYATLQDRYTALKAQQRHEDLATLEAFFKSTG